MELFGVSDERERARLLAFGRSSIRSTLATLGFSSLGGLASGVLYDCCFAARSISLPQILGVGLAAGFSVTAIVRLFEVIRPRSIVRQLLAENRCTTCGYPIMAIPESARCPECGNDSRLPAPRRDRRIVDAVAGLLTLRLNGVRTRQEREQLLRSTGPDSRELAIASGVAAAVVIAAIPVVGRFVRWDDLDPIAQFGVLGATTCGGIAVGVVVVWQRMLGRLSRLLIAEARCGRCGCPLKREDGTRPARCPACGRATVPAAEVQR